MSLKGTSTSFLYYWDEIYGWIHISEKDKLAEAYERWKKLSEEEKRKHGFRSTTSRHR